MIVLYGLASLTLLGAYCTLAAKWVAPRPWPVWAKISGMLFLLMCGLTHLHMGIHALDGAAITPEEMASWHALPAMVTQAVAAWVFAWFMLKSYGTKLRTAGIVGPIVGTLVLGAFATVVLEGEPPASPAAQAISQYCTTVGENGRITLLSDDGDGTFTVDYVVGERDVAGRAPSEVDGRPAEQVYEGEVAEQLRSIGREVLRTQIPETVDTVYQGVEIHSQITYVVPGLVAFCTEIDR